MDIEEECCVALDRHWWYGSPRDRQHGDLSTLSHWQRSCLFFRRVFTMHVTALLWIAKILRLATYATLLMPGFTQIGVFYLFSKRVRRGIAYGTKSRQSLDLYFPPHLSASQRYPVVLFVTGGAWMIGYKAWGALLAKRLSDQGVIVACLDYRNYPQGNAAQMLEDVNTGIEWVCRNIADHQGDCSNIVLVGQSAGGHLASLALFRQCERAAAVALNSDGPFIHPAAIDSADVTSVETESSRSGDDATSGVAVAAAVDDDPPFTFAATAPPLPLPPPSPPSSTPRSYQSGAADNCPTEQALHMDGAWPSWDPRAFRAFVGVSGVYDLPLLHAHLRTKRVNADSLLEKIFSVAELPSAFKHFSPLTPITAMAKAAALGKGSAMAMHEAEEADGAGKAALLASEVMSAGEAFGAEHRNSRANVVLRAAARLLPRMVLIHGLEDISSPCEGSEKLSNALKGADVDCELHMVSGKTHTSFLLEDPMCGGRDMLSDTVLEVVTGQAVEHNYGSLCPWFLCRLAGWVSPF